MCSIEMKGTQSNKGRSTIYSKISELAIIKVLDKKTQSTIMLKLKFVFNSAL